MSHLLCFGLGYSAKVLAARLAAQGWRIAGTGRGAESVHAIAALGYRAFRFDGTSALPPAALDGITHILVSVPPDADGDPVLRRNAALLAERAERFAWVGYLSTTGVYGDRGGGWVNEDAPLAPTGERGVRRLAAETAWLDLHRAHGLPVHVFRLAGIYGPGRNPLAAIIDGTAQRIAKPGQVFGRIHVEDVVAVLMASIAKPNPGRVYNVCDDEPCPPQEVVSYAAHLLGRPPPPEVPFDEARLSPMARSFYAESKRVANRRIKTELGVALRYPTYREGLGALLGNLTR